MCGTWYFGQFFSSSLSSKCIFSCISLFVHLFCPQLSNAFYRSECFPFEYENFHSLFYFYFWPIDESTAKQLQSQNKYTFTLEETRWNPTYHDPTKWPKSRTKTETKRMQNEYNKSGKRRKAHPQSTCKMNNNRWEFIHLHFFVDVFSSSSLFFLSGASLNLFCCCCFWCTVCMCPSWNERKSVRARHRILKLDNKTHTDSGDSVWIELRALEIACDSNKAPEIIRDEIKKNTPIYSCKYCSSTVAITAAAAAIEKEEEEYRRDEESKR